MFSLDRYRIWCERLLRNRVETLRSGLHVLTNPTYWTSILRLQREAVVMQFERFIVLQNLENPLLPCLQLQYNAVAVYTRPQFAKPRHTCLKLHYIQQGTLHRNRSYMFTIGRTTDYSCIYYEPQIIVRFKCYHMSWN